MRFGLGFGIYGPSLGYAQLIANFITAENMLDQITNVDLANSLGA